jgi:hypothetical protein
MAETHSVFYTADEGGPVEWKVEKSTSKTWTVRIQREYSYTRLVRAADIGRTWHLTPMAALTDKADQLRRELEWAQERVQYKRTALGMVVSHMKRLESASSSDARLTDLDEGTAIGSAEKAVDVSR